MAADADSSSLSQLTVSSALASADPAPSIASAARRRSPLAARVVAVSMGAAALAVVWSAAAITSHVTDLLAFVACLAIFTAPGWPIARWYCGDRTPRAAQAPLAVLFGYVVGAGITLVLR